MTSCHNRNKKQVECFLWDQLRLFWRRFQTRNQSTNTIAVLAIVFHTNTKMKVPRVFLALRLRCLNHAHWISVSIQVRGPLERETPGIQLSNRSQVFVWMFHVQALAEASPIVQTRVCWLLSCFRTRLCTINCDIVWRQEATVAYFNLCNDSRRQPGAPLSLETEMT
jgi:hypothetical protein